MGFRMRTLQRKKVKTSMLHFRSDLFMVAALAGLGCLAASSVRADVFRLGGEGHGFPDADNHTTYYDSEIGGNGALAFGPLVGHGEDAGRVTEATSFADASLLSTHVLGISTSTLSTSNVVATSRASGAYRDIISFSGARPFTSILLTFEIHASLSITPFGPGGDGNAIIGIGFQPFGQQAGFSTNGALAQFRVGQPFSTQGFTTTNGNPADFIATFSGLVTFDSDLGGYAFQITSSVATAAFFSNSLANAGNSISIHSITNPDGSPISGANLSFASGMRFVPTPGAASLLVLGGLTAARRRRRATNK